jgi:mannose-binding lectin 2
MGHAVVDEKVKNVTALDLDEKFLNGDNMSKLRLLKLRYERMIEDFEHQITALKESTENTIKKLREQEEEDTKAIAEIEVWANSKVSQKVLSTVDVIRNEMEQKLETTVKDTVKKTGGWKTPFFILLIVIASAIGMAYKKYQDLRKSHLL